VKKKELSRTLSLANTNISRAVSDRFGRITQRATHGIGPEKLKLETYACLYYDVCITAWSRLEVNMAARVKLKRKSYFVDERALSRAKKALGVKTEAEVIRLSVERVAEMEEFWEFMKKTRRSLRPGSVEKS
jgi:hypothetical protein